MREKTPIKQILGNNVKKFRKEKHLTQAELAEMLEITPKHLSEIETGTVFASSALLESLSEIFDKPVSALLRDIEEDTELMKELYAIVDDEMFKATLLIKKRIREI